MAVKRYYTFDELQVGDYFIVDDMFWATDNVVTKMGETDWSPVGVVSPTPVGSKHGITQSQRNLIRIRSHWNQQLAALHMRGGTYEKEFYRDWVG